MDALDLLLHPVRLRIVNAMWGGHARTTSELCARLADVPKTTVYRHVGLLAGAGLLEVADERRVHGAVERRFRLNRERAAVDPDAGAAMSLDDHRHGFAAAVAALLAEFNAYLDREGADPAADLVSYKQFPLWLDDAERAALIEQIKALVRPLLAKPPTPGRSPVLLSTILFPTEAPPAPDDGEPSDPRADRWTGD
ncbi:helix-turn-helix protein [Allonocardiopsis opalescens]|uniref:Helix-turn-helix protein n=1 Tax=Allonocardiopsis opalescens TaxID=1144618 RepID=A0A2T0QF16_9ACTN|nr:helix-turn-helix protein [Allonocardiopsis opalescens]